jgi:hypothetical protein
MTYEYLTFSTAHRAALELAHGLNAVKEPEEKKPLRPEWYRPLPAQKQQGVSLELYATPQTGRPTYSCNQVPV